MVEQRLKGVRGSVPSKVYARPLVLRPGLVIEPAALRSVLNGLRYAERESAAPEPGQFARARAGILLFPRPVDGRRERAAARLLRHGQGRDRAGEGDPRRAVEAQVRPAGARARADDVPLRRGAREAPPRALRGAARAPGEGRARDRGPPLLQPPRARPDPADRGRRPQHPHREGDPARRQHDHAAAVQELLPDAGAHVQAQGAGGAARLRARAPGHEAGDPRAVPERDLPRPGRLLQHQRHGRGGADVLPQGRLEPDAAGVRRCSPG